jgi:hypothetical protein
MVSFRANPLSKSEVVHEWRSSHRALSLYPSFSETSGDSEFGMDALTSDLWDQLQDKPAPLSAGPWMSP